MEDGAAMKRRHHTPEQIIRLVAEGEKLLGQGQSIDEVARHLEISESKQLTSEYSLNERTD
jgi:putative transposase